MAEYQALIRLIPPVNDRVVPLICLPDVEFDFESWRPKRGARAYRALSEKVPSQMEQTPGLGNFERKDRIWPHE